MGQRLTRKLKNDGGVTLVLALVFFLICAVIGSVVLAAATSASGRMAGLVQQQQSYYTVSSAAEYFRDETLSRTVTLNQSAVRENADSTDTEDLKFGDPEIRVSSDAERKQVVNAAVGGVLDSGSYDQELNVHVGDSSFSDVHVRFTMDSNYNIRAVFTLRNQNEKYPSRMTLTARAVENVKYSNDQKKVTRTTTISWEKGVITKG